MKKYINNLFILVILASDITGLSAQEKEFPDSSQLRKFGLGLNLEKNIFDGYYYFYTYPPAFLTFSVNIKDKFRLEPEAGFNFVSHYDDYDESKEKHYTLTFGVGTYGLTPKGSIYIIYGCKLYYLHYKYNSKNSSENEHSSNGVSFGPVVGLDYVISSHFTIGADFKLLYYYQITKNDYNTDDNVVEETSNTYLETIAGLKFRFYF